MTNVRKHTKPKPAPRMGYLRTDTTTWRALQALAKREQLTDSPIVRRALREFLSRGAA